MSTPPFDPDTPSAPPVEGGVSLSAGRLSIDGDVVGRDKVTIIQQLTALPGLPTDHATPIQNFLYEYLGLPGQRVPFGGREAELAALDAWLTSEQTPPFALLAAEAGRGKSALLVYWAARLRASGAHHVVFIPVSLRFGTALASVTFTGLAARLGEVYGEPVKWANLSAEEWRGVCQSYLARTPPDGKPLVVILDGLDEAAGWEAGAGLFPRVLPPGVRLVVSARTLAGDGGEQGWRRRLGWEGSGAVHCLPLPPLTRTGVGEVLAAMGNPLDRLATRVNVVGELFRLSEGDPLLVRLYVEALLPYGEQAALLEPESLTTLQPGLAGYFDSWWEDQETQWREQKRDPLTERASTAEFFNACAAALGPLSVATLAEVAGGDLASAMIQRRIAGDLGRFVIGDGKAQGYNFSHPRLGYHFWEQMTPREQQRWESRFLTHGEQVLDALNRGEIAPAAAPPYAVQYYGAHLERARAPDAAFYALISEGWMRAWEALEGTFAGFLSDVARAWQRADQALAAGREPGTALVQQVKAALCQSSIAALSANIPPDLLALAVQHGLYTPVQALVLIRQDPMNWRRAQSLVCVAPLFPPPLLPQALDVARSTEEDVWRAAALTALALRFDDETQAEVLAEALTAARAIQYAVGRVRALTGLAPHMDGAVQEEVLPEAMAEALTIRDERERGQALSGLVPHLNEAGLREVLAAVRVIGDKRHRILALTGLASRLGGAAQEEILTEVLAARATEDEGMGVVALRGLVPYLSEEGMPKALIAARAIEDEGRRAAALTVLAPHLSEEGVQREVVKEALASARWIGSEWRRTEVLRRLIPYLSEVGLREALAAARAIKDEGRRSAVLRGLAARLSEAGLREVLAAARAIKDEGRRAEVLTGLTSHLSEAGRREVLNEALAAARAIGGEGRAAALTWLAPHLSGAVRGEVLTEALTAARAIGAQERRAEAMTRLASHLSEAVRGEALTEALAAVPAIKHEGIRAAMLRGLAPHLSEVGMREALMVARAIEDEGWRMAALTWLAPHLSGIARGEVVTEALAVAWVRGEDGWRAALTGLGQGEVREVLAAARARVDQERRAEVLVGLAPYLDEVEVREALAAARAIANEGSRAAALAGLAPYLDEAGVWEALAAARAIENERSRAAALTDLAPHLSEAGVREALVAARAIGNEGSRATALTGLVPHLSEAGIRGEVVNEALAAARAIGFEGWRAAALTGLAPYLSSPVQPQALTEALAAICSTERRWREDDAFHTLAPLLAERVPRDRPGMLQAWSETLHALARYPRPDFLNDLAALLPFALALAGDEKQDAADGILHAILEVCEWWP